MSVKTAKKRYKFQIMSGVHGEGFDTDIVSYGPSYTDKEGNEHQSQVGGNIIETDVDLAARHNTPGCPAKFLQLEDRGEASSEPDLSSMNLKALRAWAKGQEPPIDLEDASNAEEARNIIQLCLDAA
jgi:hypothetical protein